MDNHAAYYLPNYLNEPARLVVFTVDEALIFLPLCLLGLMFNYMLVLSGAGVLLLLVYKGFKGKRGFEYVLALMYWFCPRLHLFKSLSRLHSHYFIG